MLKFKQNRMAQGYTKDSYDRIFAKGDTDVVRAGVNPYKKA